VTVAILSLSLFWIYE